MSLKEALKSTNGLWKELIYISLILFIIFIPLRGIMFLINNYSTWYFLLLFPWGYLILLFISWMNLSDAPREVSE